jgi:hypothetical protein
MHYISHQNEMDRLFAKINLLIKELYLYRTPDSPPLTKNYMSDEIGYPCGLRKRIIHPKKK